MTAELPIPVAQPAEQSQEELQARFDQLFRLISEDPSNPDLRVKLGYVALDMGRRNEAIAAFVRALQLDPSMAFVRARLEQVCTPIEMKLFRVPEQVTPYWNDIAGILAYPFRGRGLGILVIGMVCSVGLTLLTQLGGIAGLFCGLVASGYLAAYFVSVVKTSGVGQKEPPDWPDIGHPFDLIGHSLHWLLAGIASYLPAVLISLLPGLPLALRLPLLGAAGLLGLFMYPMAVLITSLYGSGFAAFNYPFLVQSILRIVREYVLAWAVLFVAALTIGLFVVVGGALGFGALLAGQAVGGSVVGGLIFLGLYMIFSAGLTLYCYMVFCRLLGQIYYFSQRKLGWFEG